MSVKVRPRHHISPLFLQPFCEWSAIFMATIRKTKSKTWVAEVKKFGQYKSKTFPTKLQAQAWAVEIEQTRNPQTIEPGKSVGDALLRYQLEVSPSKKSWRNS